MTKEDTKHFRMKKFGKGKNRGRKKRQKNDQLLREKESFMTFLERRQVGDASVRSREVVPGW